MEIFKAHQQWKSRPADERFPTLQALYEQTRYYADHAKEVEVPWEKLSVAHINGEMILQGEQNRPKTTQERRNENASA